MCVDSLGWVHTLILASLISHPPLEVIEVHGLPHHFDLEALLGLGFMRELAVGIYLAVQRHVVHSHRVGMGILSFEEGLVSAHPVGLCQKRIAFDLLLQGQLPQQLSSVASRTYSEGDLLNSFVDFIFSRVSQNGVR